MLKQEVAFLTQNCWHEVQKPKPPTNSTLHIVLTITKKETQINMESCVLFICRSVGQQPFRRIVPELQHPAAGGGVRAAVRGRQRSAVRPQHLQHLHTWKPHGECRDAREPRHRHALALRTPRYHKFSPVSQASMEDKLIIASSRLSGTHCVPPILWISD